MNQPVSDTTAIEQKVEAKIDAQTLSVAEISNTVGGLAFKDMGQVMEFSKLMAIAGQAVPKHLRGKPGACMAVSMQALNWRMDPFAVANKSYMVNDRIAYEAQLIHAVIEQRAPIKGRLKGKYVGDGDDRQVVLTCISAEDGDTIEYQSPKIGAITVKNSPLWKSDPDQQLWYYSARAMCRRHFPDVLLGVYEKEEILNAPEMKDVTPQTGGFAAMAKTARGEQDEPEDIEGDAAPEQEPGQPIDGEILPPEEESQDAPEIDPSEFEFAEGVSAANDEQTAADCPYGDDDLTKKAHWLAGFKEQSKLNAESDG